MGSQRLPQLPGFSVGYMATPHGKGSIRTLATTCKICDRLDRQKGARFKDLNAMGCQGCSSIRQAISGYYQRQSLLDEAKIVSIHLCDKGAGSVFQNFMLYTNDGH